MESDIRDRPGPTGVTRRAAYAEAVAQPPALMVWTIGHSTRSLADLVALLQEHRVTRLVDVRRMPHSKRHPQFDTAALAHDLPAAGIDYRHSPGLGGFRTPRENSVNTAWRTPAFRGYADYMQTTGLRRAPRGIAHRRDDRGHRRHVRRGAPRALPPLPAGRRAARAGCRRPSHPGAGARRGAHADAGCPRGRRSPELSGRAGPLRGGLIWPTSPAGGAGRARGASLTTDRQRQRMEHVDRVADVEAFALPSWRCGPRDPRRPRPRRCPF